MKTKAKDFLLVFFVFATGLFFGEWLIDFILKFERDALVQEIIQSVIVGFLVGVFFIFNSKNFKKKN